MNETPTIPQNPTIQNLVDVWERRPRRQLDYSLLTEESRQDVMFTTDVLLALIPAMKQIREKFGIEPTPPIVIQLPPPQAQPKPSEAEAPASVSEHGKNRPEAPQSEITIPATRKGRARGKDAVAPNKPVEKAQGKGRNSGIPKTPSKPARSVVTGDHKSGNRGKRASVAATHPPTPSEAPKSEPSSPQPEPPKLDGANLTDPPAPKLEPIG